MNTHRKGETGSIPFRSGRFFNVDTKWYFSCREGMDQGPYENRKRAEAALKQHIEKCNQVDRVMHDTA